MSTNPESGPALRVSRRVWLGVTLACCSAALYSYFALYWAISTIAEDDVQPGDMSLRGGAGVILTLVALAGAAVSLFAAWSGHRLWHRDKITAAVALIVGSAIGVLPAAALVLAPASA